MGRCDGLCVREGGGGLLGGGRLRGFVRELGAQEDGLGIVSRKRWGMEWIHFFGLIFGWGGGGVPLRERFRRLFDLSVFQSSTVAEMSSLGWEVGGNAWVWRRQLWVWVEAMLREC
jgi:hypothetical protein